MISKATAKYLRVSPRKVRGVIALIKGKYVNDARDILKNTNKKSAVLLMKLLNSAVANAKRIPNMREEDLYICDMFADGGPSLKRFKAQAMGRATMIKRRTSHLTVKLDVREQKVSAEDNKRVLGLKKPKAATPKAKTVKASAKKTTVNNTQKEKT